MGRPAKNPNHPLVRLRMVLTTKNHEFTRKDLSKKTGIAETSIKDIESGEYKLTNAVALRVAYATGVHPRSLIHGEDPLLDLQGQPFSSNSQRMEYLALSDVFRGARRQLFEAAWDAAVGKKKGLLLSLSFDNWLLTTVQELGLESLLSEKLTERLGLFDPQEIPMEFLPKNLSKEWTAFKEEIDKEQLSLQESTRNTAERVAMYIMTREIALEKVASRRAAKPVERQSRSLKRAA